MLGHPDYYVQLDDWNKWRLAYRGGRDFISTYLKKLSARESNEDFETRLGITYCPSFAKLGINEVRDSIYNRMIDITRDGGTPTYMEAIKGEDYGVDRLGSSMNYFMGCKILPELLTMQKVGIYMDMPPLMGESMADNEGIRPYIYYFCVEDILNWTYDEHYGCNEFASILLHERLHSTDPDTGFPQSTVSRYRRLWKDLDGSILACFYDNEKKDRMLNQYGEPIDVPIDLGIDRIPFVLLDIGESLMIDAADYQIALLNLASTDMIYALKANFPFYTEQYDARINNQALRPDGTRAEDVEVGVSQGRRYPMDADRPGFIHPSSEPLEASMKKQEQIKQEMRLLLKLAISTLTPPGIASAESKVQDTRSLKNGLAYIGLVLENGERKIADFWAMYEGSSQIATVNYPTDYDLLNEKDRREEAEYLEDVMNHVTSPTFQRVAQKRLSHISLGTKVSTQTTKTIEKEIDTSPALINDPETIFKAVEMGLCSLDLGSKLLGFPKGEVDKAKEDHAERLRRIMEAQTVGEVNMAARGVKDADQNIMAAKDEKTLSRDTTKSDVPKSRVRGPGRRFS